MKRLDLKVDELADPEYRSILNRAQERVEAAIQKAVVPRELRNYGIEIPSFPIAIMIVIALANPYLKKRYALAEAKGAFHLLLEEDGPKIVAIAENFGWNIQPVAQRHDREIHDFLLHFQDFLKNSTILRDERWKLVNQSMHKGSVYLTKIKASRLLQEEVQRYIESKLGVKAGSLPSNIIERVEQLKQFFFEKKGELRLEGPPKMVVTAAFPPCIRDLYDTIKSGYHLSHIGRFTLTSFLINSGMTVEHVVDLFRSFSDFDEKMTRYQVEHIAGEKGGRNKYIPPKCDTLRTHGVCVGADSTCRAIRHPLSYYRRKMRALKKMVVKAENER